MRAAFFDKPGMDNLRVGEFENPRPGPGEVLIRVRFAGVNPVDYFIINRGGKPMPHIPGAEFSGVVEALGQGVSGVNVGDEVVVYVGLFDGTCRYCLMGREEACINPAGMIGADTQGGFAEYAVVPARNVIKLPKGVTLEAAATVPVGALTAYHLVERVNVGLGELVVVMGATGNVGTYAVQFSKLRGATVIAVTRRASRVAQQLRELGADYVVTPSELEGLVKELSGGLGADVVIDSVGQATWSLGFNVLAKYGRWGTAGSLTGGDVTLSIPSLYRREVSLVGSTGGSRAELIKVLELMSKGLVKAPIHARLSLDRVKEAFDIMFKGEDRVGKVLLTP